MMDAESVVETLNGLIRTMEDEHAALRRAAELCDDADARRLLGDLAARRGAMVRDLQTRVAEYGGVPDTGGTAAGGAIRMFAELKGRIAGRDRAGLLRDAERSEAAAARRLEDALAGGLPPHASALVADLLDRMREDMGRIAQMAGTPAG